MEARDIETKTADLPENSEKPSWLTRAAHGFCLAVSKIGYRVEVRGLENLPREGGALIAPNHVSYPDALFVMEAAGRPVRFVMDRDIYGWPLLNTICRFLRVIPVSEKDRRANIAGFVAASREALEAGELLCIFPEGMVTKDGQLNKFRNGYTWIVRGLDVPVIPARIDGAWGSALSHAHGKILTSVPSVRRLPVTVTFGRPLPATVTPAELRAAVAAL